MSRTIQESIESAFNLQAAAAKYETQSSKKLALIKSIRKRVAELESFRGEIEDEIRENVDYGEEVKRAIQECGTERDVEKFSLVVRDLEPTIGLIFSLSGRLARCERALEAFNALAEQFPREDLDRQHQYDAELELLLQKRRTLEVQLHEAQDIKSKVETRQEELSRRLRDLLTPDDYETFASFIRQKVQLFQQRVELEDKAKLGDEQLRALLQSMSGLDVGVE